MSERKDDANHAAEETLHHLQDLLTREGLLVSVRRTFRTWTRCSSTTTCGISSLVLTVWIMLNATKEALRTRHIPIMISITESCQNIVVLQSGRCWWLHSRTPSHHDEVLNRPP